MQFNLKNKIVPDRAYVEELAEAAFFKVLKNPLMKAYLRVTHTHHHTRHMTLCLLKPNVYKA